MSEKDMQNEGEVNSVQVAIVDEIDNDAPVIVTHPWHRYFARSFDLMIASVLISIILLPILILSENINLHMNFLVLAFITLFISLFIEAGLISLFGTTIGKFAFGIKILTLEGKKLTYKQGLKRSLGVWVKGLGLGIPIVSFFTQIATLEKISDGGIAWWDEKGGFIVHHKGISKLRVVFFILLYFVIYIGSSFVDFFL